MVDVPSIDFKYLLSHTFPGFFSAITLFMLIDLLSPLNLTGFIDSIEGLAGFVGFVLLIGTILGILLDAFQHAITERLFIQFKGLKEIRNCLKKDTPSCGRMNYSLYCLFKYKNKDALPIRDALNGGYYYYSEFFASTLLSLTLFSFIAPFYLFEVFSIPWRQSIIIGLASLSVAYFSIYSSYIAMKAFIKAILGVICSSREAKECPLPIRTRGKFRVPPLVRNLIWFLVIYFVGLYLTTGRLLINPWIALAGIIIGSLLTGYNGCFSCLSEDETTRSISVPGDALKTKARYLTSKIKVLQIEIREIKGKIDSMESGHGDLFGADQPVTDSLETLVNDLSKEVGQLAEKVDHLPADPKMISKDDRQWMKDAEKLLTDAQLHVKTATDRSNWAKAHLDESTSLIGSTGGKTTPEVASSIKTVLVDLESIRKILQQAKAAIAESEKTPNAICRKLGRISYHLNKLMPTGPFEATTTTLTAIFFVLLTLGVSYSPANISVEPPSLAENFTNLSLRNDSIISFQIINSGDNISPLELKIEGLNGISALFVKDNDSPGDQVKGRTLSRTDIRGESVNFFEIHINASAVPVGGAYRGSVDVTGKSKYGEVKKRIPITLNIEK
ncbi:MAG: hypothetical protein GKC10_07460 [Methanosarcinales archaeon]|nr:hypothetical protein [Methanosarcinales archaeon]